MREKGKTELSVEENMGAGRAELFCGRLNGDLIQFQL